MQARCKMWRFVCEHFRTGVAGEGVCVQASTLGSLEALLEFLKSPAVKIPVSGINIGPVHRRDIMRASVMLEKGRKKFACLLAFDVTVTREARELSESLGVRVFTADIIYHLFDQFTAYLKTVRFFYLTQIRSVHSKSSSILRSLCVEAPQYICREEQMCVKSVLCLDLIPGLPVKYFLTPAPGTSPSVDTAGLHKLLSRAWLLTTCSRAFVLPPADGDITGASTHSHPAQLTYQS